MSTELSNHLPTAIQQAVEDLKACRVDPKYTLNMLLWHAPHNDTCAVCLAGAVMAKRLGCSPKENLFPSNFPAEEYDILVALNLVRLGHLDEACERAGFQTVRVPLMVREFIGLGSRDDTLFKKDCKRLLELADYLESIELKTEPS